MKAPFIGRGLAIAVLAGLAVFGAVRTSRVRAAVPRLPFPAPQLDAPLAGTKGQARAVFAGGCFWGTQAVYQHTAGVLKVVSGYSGGKVHNPYYELVSSGSTGHAESIEITYDPSKISYGKLLMIFFSVAHDPTELNRQGPDVGTQYRSAIFYSTDEQKRIATAYAEQLNALKVYDRPIVTEITPFTAFYPAEDYHQDYLEHHRDNPYIRANDLPKLDRLKAEFPALYR